MPKVKQFKEEEALEKAMHLFWKKGYSATSMQDIVSHLGLSRSSIYDTFIDKETLFHKALDFYIQNNGGKFSVYVDQVRNNELDARTLIYNLLSRMAHESLNDPERKGCFAANSTAECSNYSSATTQLLALNRDHVTTILTKVIAHGQQVGSIQSTAPADALATYLFTFLNGLKITSRIDDDDPARFKQSVDFAMKALDA